uniref:non-specific serine/threonine protein kinase n=1 Tax=Oryza punctata TaxID=4537 RepID=A0A0E0L8D1_ORYPU
MASPAATLALLLLPLLASLVFAAAQSGQSPPPPQGSSTNTSDAAALHAVFKQWGLEDGNLPQGYHPCGKLVWNVTGFRNITFIPEELFNLTALVSLDLSNNNLSGPITPNIANLTKLEIWWMFDNNIDGEVPEFIADFTNLKDLRIYGMKLRGPIPNKFSNMTNLTYLMIGDLDGDNFPFDFIGDWANLSVLDLRSNNLTGPIKQVLQDNRRVQHLDVTYNPLLNGSLSNNFAGGSEEISLLNCLDMKECNQTVTNPVPFAVNCGGKEYTSDLLQTVFHDDSTDLRSAGFHIDSSNSWVVSHVGADPFSNSIGIVNTTKNISGTDMHDLYRTARTSTGSLWYYVVGLTSGRYTVQLFFAEIVIENESGRRLFNIDIQGRTFKTDFNIFEEARGFNKATNITLVENVTTSVLKIHLYWNGRGTCCIPRNGTYGPLISAIRVFPYTEAQGSPPPVRHTSRRDEKRRGVVAGIAALSIAAAVIFSSVVYLWWKWISLVKHPKA